jgi:hypothetical protein
MIYLLEGLLPVDRVDPNVSSKTIRYTLYGQMTNLDDAVNVHDPRQLLYSMNDTGSY